MNASKRLHAAGHRGATASVLVVLVMVLLLPVYEAAASAKMPAPHLSGQHFRITVLEGGSLRFPQADDEDDSSFSGYLIDMLQAVAAGANFTYDLLTPSGYGSQCIPQLNLAPNDTSDTEATKSNASAQQRQQGAYSSHYHFQYNCGTNDVVELQRTNFATDMYWGEFSITPERQKGVSFTFSYQPPFRGTPSMFGTVTGLETIQDLIQKQALGEQPPVCLQDSTATMDIVRASFPNLKIKPFIGKGEDMYESMVSGECPIHIGDTPYAEQFVLKQSQKQQCGPPGKPIGVIGEPMESGFSQYGIGVGRHLDREVVDTLSYWINVLMVNGTLASFYRGVGGTGKECGYVLFPQEAGESRLLPEWAIACVALAAVGLVIMCLCTWYRYRLKQQEKRYKKRFVQQIARNIEIGRRPGSISPEKLSEEILHIGEGKDSISKEDLSKWMHDIKMDFISQKDFDALWGAMDVDDSGEVDAVQFVVFLSACGPEFEQVYEEQLGMPKKERLKLAARRLTSLKIFGEEGVRRIENNLESSSRGAKRLFSQTRKTTGSSTSQHSQEPSVQSHEDSLLDTVR